MATRGFMRTHRLLRSCAYVLRQRSAHEDNFLNGTTASYVEDMYNAWLKDKKSVHASWDSYFKNVTQGASPAQAYQSPPTIRPPSGQSQSTMTAPSGPTQPTIKAPKAPSPATSGKEDKAKVTTQSTAAPVSNPQPPAKERSDGPISEQLLDYYLTMQNIVRSYQTRGHLIAHVDPLEMQHGGLNSTIKQKATELSKLVVREYMLGMGPEIMDTEFKLPNTTFIAGADKKLTLREIIRRIETAYCESIGVEYMFITNYAQSQWLRQKFETPGIRDVSAEQKKVILERLVRATGFEAFLARKFVSEKRFGLEGCEVLIPAIKDVIDHCSADTVDFFIIGMPHRGRLNVIANVLRQPLVKMFTQFASLDAEEDSSGDVKYHLGSYVERLNRNSGKNVAISLVANPSHLEAVDPIVMGKTKAEQFYRGDDKGDRVLGILIHGDAAFCGQGVVYECMHLSNLTNYTTHGTIHLIVNNQIGFTTDPRFSRSSPYCTDVARVTKSPIFHVNGDDPEAVMYCVKAACDFRQTFKKDVVIDIVCYRRNGHNEIDEPSFTQPLMYRKIRAMPNVLEKYAKKLIAEGVVTDAWVKETQKTYDEICEKDFELAKSERTIKWRDWIDSPWKGFFNKTGPRSMTVKPTGVDEETLRHIADKFSSPPGQERDFECHKGLDRVFRQRKEMAAARQADWAIGEALAFGTLLKEKVHVRLSGQDVERGTFSHRHHVLHHQTRDKEMFVPLKHLYPGAQAEYTVCNSSISEMGVLGFEIGYSIANPNALIMWEAQFGDFNNGGQVMIDQFLAGGEAKWIRQTGLVMLNPHGMEGMGPEHSSARLERFLMMSDDDPDTMPDVADPEFVVKQLRDINWFVANCTTPANLFHILRRQIALPFRKPLILMSPKSLLRHPECRSSFDDMIGDSSFQRVISESGPASQSPQGVKKLIFCSGKIYYELKKEREKRKLTKEIAINRIEQLSPFPYDLVLSEVEKYKQAELCWAQEEHKNMGPWAYVIPRFATALQECEKEVMTYAGRPTSSSPATGNKIQFIEETDALLDAAMVLETKTPPPTRSRSPPRA